MYQRMLVPLDGSQLSEGIISYAREVAIALDLDLDFLHVADILELQVTPMSQFYLNEVAESVKEQIHRIQTTTGDKQKPTSVEVRGQVVTGHPAKEILKYAGENPIDIILMATHVPSNIHLWPLGSVAYKVLRDSKIPVWLVHSHRLKEIVYDQWLQRTILVPLDGSELAEAALPHAAALAKQHGTQVTDIVLLSVYEPYLIPKGAFNAQPDYPPDAPTKYEDYAQQEDDKAKDSCEKYLKKIASRLFSKGIAARTEVIKGKAAKEIIKCANKDPMQLIVMTSHGQSGTHRSAFGSVAKRVSVECKTPIFMVILKNKPN